MKVRIKKSIIIGLIIFCLFNKETYLKIMQNSENSKNSKFGGSIALRSFVKRTQGGNKIQNPKIPKSKNKMRFTAPRKYKTQYSKKLVTVGDGDAGRSSLLFRITHNTEPHISDSTLGGAYYETCVGGCKLKMWDTAGQERFRSMVPMYLKDVDIIFLVYDTSDYISFQHLKEYWIKFAHKHATGGNHFYILIANKSDLKMQRAVPTEAGIKLAKTVNAAFIELSALNGNNVDKLLTLIIDECLDKDANTDTSDTEGKDETIVILDDKRTWFKLPSTQCNC